jgi:hypothetical protein
MSGECGTGTTIGGSGRSYKHSSFSLAILGRQMTRIDESLSMHARRDAVCHYGGLLFPICTHSPCLYYIAL